MVLNFKRFPRFVWIQYILVNSTLQAMVSYVMFLSLQTEMINLENLDCSDVKIDYLLSWTWPQINNNTYSIYWKQQTYQSLSTLWEKREKMKNILIFLNIICGIKIEEKYAKYWEQEGRKIFEYLNNQKRFNKLVRDHGFVNHSILVSFKYIGLTIPS